MHKIKLKSCLVYLHVQYLKLPKQLLYVDFLSKFSCVLHVALRKCVFSKVLSHNTCISIIQFNIYLLLIFQRKIQLLFKMRLFGKKFIPGVRVEVEDENTSNNNNGKKIIKDLDIVSNHSEQSTATTYEPNSEETTNDDYDEENYETALESFEAFTST